MLCVHCSASNRVFSLRPRSNPIKLIILGYSLESKDELVDALPTLKKRAAEDDANILFSVASDLSKVKPQHLLILLNGLLPSFLSPSNVHFFFVLWVCFTSLVPDGQPRPYSVL